MKRTTPPFLSCGTALLLACLLCPLMVVCQTDSARTAEIAFTSEGHTLFGRMYTPAAGTHPPTLILLHGFPGNEKDVLGLGGKLAGAGVNVLTFNYSGTHRSEGSFGIESTLRNIHAAYAYLHQPGTIGTYGIDTTRILLGGYSYGGGMALVYAADHPEIGRVFSIAGTDHGGFAREYARNPDFARAIERHFEELEAPRGPVRFKGREALKWLVEHDSLVDLIILSPRLAARDILLIGGWDDADVMIERNQLPFYRALKKSGASSVRFAAYHDNHSFKNTRGALALEIGRWVLCIPPPAILPE